MPRFRLAGAKIGGTLARAFAARGPERLITLTDAGTPQPKRPGAVESVPGLIHDFETHGVEYWARPNMANRLGSAFPPEGSKWWCQYMGRTAVSTQVGFMPAIACADITADLPNITCDRSGEGPSPPGKPRRQARDRPDPLIVLIS